MRIKCLLLLVCLPHFILVKLSAQELKFESALNWKEIKAKAVADNKYIFLDFFTTWCGPCKKMDTEVYTNEEVGKFMNSKFVSVKVQMDKTPNDNEFVRSWYEDVTLMAAQYSIKFYPTYIFLSPQGNIVHRSGGFLPPDDFIATAEKALGPARNLSEMMDSFKKGDMRLDQILDLALSLMKSGQKEEANEVANAYFDYLNKLSLDSLLNASHLNFILKFSSLVRPATNTFNVFYLRSQEVDKIIRKGVSKNLVNYVILAVLVKPKIWKDGIPIEETPDWDGIYNGINWDFGKEYAEKNLTQGKLIWFNQRKDWDSVAKYYTQKIETQGIDTTLAATVELNNVAYNIFFLQIKDKYYLEKAATWLKYLIEIMPYYYQAVDTYASIIYKIGDRDKAIDWENKALALAINRKDNKSVEIFKSNILKMKKNQPIW